MPAIVLTTLNARYPHCAFGLRYLQANLGPLAAQSVIREFTIQQDPRAIVEALLADEPRVIGLGVYIWNATETLQVVRLLRQICPDVCVVLGGPEVSYEVAEQPICQLADYVITGEADLAFAELCAELLGANPQRLLRPDVAPVVIAAPVPALTAVKMPYALYQDEDLAQRVIYVEASRGCPFTCEFCLSALEIPVRQFPLDEFLAAMQDLLDRGARAFKFVDRTFNLNVRISRAILQFFLDRYRSGLFLHFEMIPDRFPTALRDLVSRFPAGALQFEVGVQTWNDAVAERISRRQDNLQVETNLRWLRAATGVHVHADLIVGLPGEDEASFAEGFDRLVALGPQEIQVGMLKRLRGTPIVRHDGPWKMLYEQSPPYEVVQTSVLSFAALQRLRRFAKTWDLLANSGNFGESTPWFWRPAAIEPATGSPAERPQPAAVESPFAAVMTFSEWLFAQVGRTHGIALTRLVELVFRFLTEVRGWPAEVIAPVVARDYRRGGRSDWPGCLRPWLKDAATVAPAESLTTGIPARQQRHQPHPGGSAFDQTSQALERSVNVRSGAGPTEAETQRSLSRERAE